MNMRRFAPVEGNKEKTVGTYPQDRRHLKGFYPKPPTPFKPHLRATLANLENAHYQALSGTGLAITHCRDVTSKTITRFFRRPSQKFACALNIDTKACAGMLLFPAGGETLSKENWFYLLAKAYGQLPFFYRYWLGRMDLSSVTPSKWGSVVMMRPACSASPEAR